MKIFVFSFPKANTHYTNTVTLHKKFHYNNVLILKQPLEMRNGKFFLLAMQLVAIYTLLEL